MKISIVTISFNQARFLEQAILSVLNQSYPDMEYIIVDPGSTDGSRGIIDKYRSRLAAVIFEPDEGPTGGLNKGFRLATGDICGYLNADDAYLPGAFEKVAAVFNTRLQADVVYGHGYIIDAEGHVIRRFYSDSFNLRRYLYGGVSVMQQSTFFKRSAFVDVGGFNPTNKTCWDGELLVDFAIHKKAFRRLDDFLSVFRIHRSSISGSGRLDSQYQMDLQRIFLKAYGRPKKSHDKLLSQFARLEKWILNPKALRSRIADLVFPQTKVPSE